MSIPGQTSIYGDEEPPREPTLDLSKAVVPNSYVNWTVFGQRVMRMLHAAGLREGQEFVVRPFEGDDEAD